MNINDAQLKKQIQAAIDAQELVRALAVTEYILAYKKDELEAHYRSVISKHQLPVQPKDHEVEG